MLTCLSGGRLRLGVGIGWNPVEYEALGQEYRTRGARQEEQIELLRRLFTEPVVDFSGRFDRVDRAALVPKPMRPRSDLARWIWGEGIRPRRPACGWLHLLRWRRRSARSTPGGWNVWSSRRLGRSVGKFGGRDVTLSGGDLGKLAREIDALAPMQVAPMPR